MESKKPKLFISQPMQGKSIEEIFAEREEAAKKATSLVKRDMEVIDSYIQDAPEGAKPLWFLGKSLELMADADVVYFAEGWQKARGCQLEYECARAYADDDFVYYEHEPRWIPCSERMPEMYEEEVDGESFRYRIDFCSALRQRCTVVTAKIMLADRCGTARKGLRVRMSLLGCRCRCHIKQKTA